MQTSSTIPVYNLGCDGGGSLMVEHTLTRITGVAHAYVNPATEMAYVKYDPTLVRLEQLQAMINAIGYGPPLQPIVKVESPQPLALDTRRLALTAGLWLAALYSACLILDACFAPSLQLYRIWEFLLIGVTWAQPETLLLGVIETFLSGALGAWLLATMYRALPPFTHT